MVSCMGELHLWTLKKHTIIPENDTGIFTYHEKNDGSGEQPYSEEKIQYTESRDATWTPKNKRPDRLRDNLKEFEDTMAAHRVIRTKWLSRKFLQIYLGNGAVVSIIISLHTGDIDRLLLDKSLVGKLSAEHPFDVLITDQYLVYSYSDKAKLDFVYFTKRPPVDATRKLEKISSYEPKISQTDLPGPVGRKLKRYLTNNIHNDQVLAWWPTASEEAWPWSPMTGDQERANLVLLLVNQARLDVMTYTRTEGDPLSVTFSMCQPHLILSVEQASTGGDDAVVDICSFDSTRTKDPRQNMEDMIKLQRQTVTTIPLKSRVVCLCRNLTENKVILGCEDSSLVLYDEDKKLTQTTTATVAPSMLAWHPSGTIVVAASRKGEIQLFDMALSPLLVHLVVENPRPKPALELSFYFKSPPMLEEVLWGPLAAHQVVAECTDYLSLVFDRGPVGVLQYHLGAVSQGRLSPLLLLNQYIKHQQMDEAVNLLGAQDWNSEGQLCYACLSTIVNHLLRQPLNPDREAQLEAALGTFYAPPKPISEVTVLEYREPISRLARRFFHHLLRFSRFDKAFLLAVDIGARDLFMDIHYLAADKGETALSEVARQKADQMDTESIDADSADGYEDAVSDEDDDRSLNDSYDDVSDEDVHINNSQNRHHGLHPSGTQAFVLPQRQVPVPMAEYANHPAPQPMYTMSPADARFIPQYQRQKPSPSTYNRHQQYMGLPEAALQQLEDELSGQMFTEYTAALLDEIPPPQLTPDELLEEAQPEPGATPRNVKVTHFGIV